MPGLVKGLFGKLFGDCGYVSRPLFKVLYDEGVQLVTKLKRGMRNRLLPFFDQIMLRRRAIIESVTDQLKNISQIEHSRHRSVANCFVNLAGWAHRLDMAREEAVLEYPSHRAVAAACVLSSLTSNSR